MRKSIIRLAIITAAILMIPVVAMQVSEGWNWSGFDFVFAGTLIFGTGLAYLLISKIWPSTEYRIATGLALLTGFLLIWINSAVGIIGPEDNPANLMYGVVIAIGFFGAITTRLKPEGLSRVLWTMTLAQLLVPVIAFFVWKPTLTEAPGMLGVFVLNTIFAILFAGSALLYRQSAGINVPKSA